MYTHVFEKPFLIFIKCAFNSNITLFFFCMSADQIEKN